MDLRDLKLFLHLAESRHFGRSSKAMHVSPSTLSRQIQRLEEELGQPLFQRDNRTVQLTSAGEQLKNFAQQTLLHYQQLRSGLNQTAYQIGQVVPGFPNANLTFGLQPGDAYERSPLDRFERYPGDGEAAGGSKKDRFRYYRSFPPTPVVNTLP